MKLSAAKFEYDIWFDGPQIGANSHINLRVKLSPNPFANANAVVILFRHLFSIFPTRQRVNQLQRF
jgi:hypothetical protein